MAVGDELDRQIIRAIKRIRSGGSSAARGHDSIELSPRRPRGEDVEEAQRRLGVLYDEMLAQRRRFVSVTSPGTWFRCEPGPDALQLFCTHDAGLVDRIREAYRTTCACPPGRRCTATPGGPVRAMVADLRCDESRDGVFALVEAQWPALLGARAVVTQGPRTPKHSRKGRRKASRKRRASQLLRDEKRVLNPKPPVIDPVPRPVDPESIARLSRHLLPPKVLDSERRFGRGGFWHDTRSTEE